MQDLAKKACGETTRLPGESAQTWGWRVHAEFNTLLTRAGEPELFGETGYLNGAQIQKNGSAWPAGTTAPDGVFGTSRTPPKALFDLMAGDKGICASWIDTVATNLGALVDGRDVAVFTLR